MTHPPPIPFTRVATCGGVDLEQGHVTYHVAGREGPPVILLPGASPDNGTNTWRWVVDDRARGHRLFSPDLPQHGAAGRGAGRQPRHRPGSSS